MRRCVFVRDSKGEFGHYYWLVWQSYRKKLCREYTGLLSNLNTRVGAQSSHDKVFDILNETGDGGELFDNPDLSYKAINMYLEFGFEPYLGAKPDNWKEVNGDFETNNKKAWEIIFDRLEKL